VVVWLFVLGPVVALACSLSAFVVIWVSDWPPRRATSEERFVRIEELQRTDDSY
jgi:RsiW-degrading membrane proteinase PrsW (M82 family)